MSKNYHGEVIHAILETLSREGVEPMTCATLAKETNMRRDSVRCACSRLAAAPRKERVLYVHDWTEEQEGEKTYLRPKYALGNRHNKKRPTPRGTTRNERYKRMQIKAGVNAFGVPLYTQQEASRRIARLRRTGA